MRRAFRHGRGRIVLLALALVAGCGGESGPTTTLPTGITTRPETTGPAATVPGLDLAADIGVSAEPCPDSTNPDNGCLYLGVLADLEGPGSGRGVAAVQAQQDFWAAANAAGGIGGFDVALVVGDTRSDPGRHADRYADLAPGIAMVSWSQGTVTSRAALAGFREDRTVTVPGSRWSGWAFEEIDGGLLLEAGASYCFEAMNAVDWVVQNAEGDPISYAIVRFPDADAGDFTAGVKLAAQASGLGSPDLELTVIPFAAGGEATLSEAIGQVAGSAPDVVFVATGHQEMATLAAGVVQGGHPEVLFVGTADSWSPDLLQQEALTELLAGVYVQVAPWEGWNGDTPGHVAMRAAAAANGRAPSTDYLAGWLSQYPLVALVEQAVENGDLTRRGGGLLAAVGQLDDVSYRGMLPDRSFVGDADAVAPRESVISRIDPNAPDGLAPITPSFAGATAASHAYTAPCFSG